MFSKLLFYFSVFGAFSLTLSEISHKSGCKLSLDDGAAFPVFLLTGSKQRLFPQQDPLTQKWFVPATSGSLITVGCSENDMANQKEIQCVIGNLVRKSDGIGEFSVPNCGRNGARQEKFAEEIYRNGTCYNGYTNVEIVINDADEPYSLITACHNEDLDETIFVKSHIRGADLDDSESVSRPDFKEGGFYPLISADDCYKQAGQIETLIELLGSESLVDEYIQTGKNLFMSRGHLAPNGDGIEAFEKRATFYFVNVVPQWQTINGANWNQLEIKARAIADERQALLTVYTGGYGVTTLDDVNNNPVELWLGKDSSGKLLKRLPVPHLTWKVIHDEQAKDAVAVIQVNNPWATIKPEDILCENVCDQLDWVSWNVEDIRLGYTYCCTVESFSKAVPYAPNLGSLPLMK